MSNGSAGANKSLPRMEVTSRLLTVVAPRSWSVAVAPAASAGASAAKAEEKPEEKAVTEEEAAAGLGDLFG